MNWQSLFTVIFALLTAGIVRGQSPESFESASASISVEGQSRLRIPSTGEALIERYGSFKGAVLNMSREEWLVMREWEEYDEHEARVIAHNAKQAIREEKATEISQRKLERQMMPGGCDCWIEPDETYTLIETLDWQYTAGAGADVDCSIGPLQLGFEFDFYQGTYDSFYINSKGSISFGDYIIDWTPEEFPNTSVATSQVAGFWADADYRSSGDIYYKITDDGVYVNFVDVGYYNNHDDLINSYQIIITPSDGVVLPEGSNTQMCYLDMNWAHGDVSGSGGCCGESPATVGVDDPTVDGNHVQYGRFNTLSDIYNGPYGGDPDNEDGVNWLDYKIFNLDVSSTSGNTPPLPSVNLGCDTVYLCQGNTFDVDLDFLGPEPGQIVTVTVTDAPGWTYVATDGEVGNVNGTFSAQMTNLGLNEITITAVDDGDPSASTQIILTFEVSPIELPELTVSGNTAICAGGEAIVTVEGEGFDAIVWSNGNTESSNTYIYGGNFFVTGYVEQCETVEYFFIDQSPYFLPDIDVTPPAVCPGQTAIVLVDPEEQVDYELYEWEGDWNGLGGTVVSASGPEAELTAGTYRLLVTDNDGCQGQRVFIIETIGSYIPEVVIDPFCDGIPDSVNFAGGYSSPQEGMLLVYMSSNETSGWGGSYLEVVINGDPSETYILTSPDDFTQWDFEIEASDTIEITFVSDSSVDPSVLSVNIYNCGFLNATLIDDLQPGVIFSGASQCTASPATGSWSCLSGPPPWSFSQTLVYDTNFYPSQYGLYEICFTEEACEIDYCYDVEITEAPSVELVTSNDLVCDGESTTVVADIEDIGGTATINWGAPGDDDVTENTFSFSSYAVYNATVTVTNGCGSANASLELTSQYTPEPSLEDESLCEGGTVYLDPTSPDTPDLEFEWYIDGGLIPGEIAEEYTAVSTGEFCVEVSNACGQGEACANISIVGEIPLPLESMTIDCLGNGTASVIPDLPEGYTVVWPDGSTDATWQVDDGSSYDGEEFCMDYTDPYGCETNTVCSYLFIGLPPTINPEPTPLEGSVLTMCPEIEYTFELNSSGAGEWEWWVTCDGQDIYVEDPVDELTLISSMLPEACWESEITLTGSALNPCATGGIRQEYQIYLDWCAIEIPNVFTPEYGDDMNESFQIPGLEVYDNVYLRVYNRWGQVVYSSNNYQSGEWRPDNDETGTYWYTLELPNGIEHKGVVTILR